MFKLGLVINPVAGVGGSVALKGSDQVIEKALQLGAKPQANNRAKTALEVLVPYQKNITVYCAENAMGENCARELGFSCQVVHQIKQTDQVDLLATNAADTKQTIQALMEQKVDLILFAGGDGTARDISAIADTSIPVLGIPAGCKIHSGVYAVTPTAAGRVVEKMLTNQLVSLSEADVMDIDESLFRKGVVKAKRYSEMLIPQELQYVQAVKSGGKESDELVLQDIAAYIIDQMEEQPFIIGSGSTTAFIMEELGLDNTLLGVDVIAEQNLVASDVTEQALFDLLSDYQGELPAKLVITLIGGQGHIFGRGNQQLSPRVIRAIGLDNIMIVATKSKLAELENKPLIVDTGDSTLDDEFTGFISVVTGYNDQVLYPVASPK